MGCCDGKDKKFSEWHGIDRSTIKWNPKIDYSKCIGCGKCAAGCGRNVYAWDFKLNRPEVVRPENCLVGCVTCSNTCLKNAISFPDKETVRELIRRGNVLSNIKNELKQKFGKTQER